MTQEATSSRVLHDRFPALLEVANSGVADFGGRLTADVMGEHRHVAATIGSYVSLLERGGKRTRGVLAATGYEMYEGSDPCVSAAAAGVVEAMHAYLLVVDDIADASNLRRGGPTAHIQMRDYFAAQGTEGDAAKLGADIATNAALYAQHRAQTVLLSLETVPAEWRLTAAQVLNDGLARTGIGQALDLVAAYTPDITTDDILKIATYKTAFYSFLLPLQVGAALAGAPCEELERFVDYSLYAGLAFQLRDDVIGVFGSESVTGKSCMSDIQEGKKTLLMTTALERADRVQRDVLLSALGRPDLTPAHFSRCLDIIRSTGALQEVTARIGEYAELACSAIEGGPAHWPPHHVQFLQGLARYCAARDA
jgi:geranylgeranyl diphosphate synthase, type I